MAKPNLNLSNKSFINPYNFVRVNWDKTYREEVSKGELSGVLHCRLLTKSPISIPELKKVENNHHYYGFMRDPQGKPFIPGSSIRGIIRNVYETVTDSCFSTTKAGQIITKRAGMREAAKPGILIRNAEGKWELYKAERHLLIMKNEEYKPFNNHDFEMAHRYTREELYNIGEGKLVYYDTTKMYSSSRTNTPVGLVIKEISSADNGQEHEGYLCIGEVPPKEKGKPQTNKHFESVFENTGTVVCKEIDNSLIKSIKYLCKMYNDPSVNRNASKGKIYNGVEQAISKGVLPVWFRKDGDMVRFSLAAIGRIRFDNTMDDLLLSKKKCESRKEVCKGCTLFGMVGSSDSVGSRLRFTDAIRENGSVPKIIKDVTLKELGGPKLSYIPFYGEKKNGKRADSYDENGIFLKGRKFYWHDIREGVYKDPTNEKTVRNSTMDLVDKGEQFEFDIFYDGITKGQLEELKWAVTLGDNDIDSRYCHKIGHGKPIGLGSVKIIIESNSVRRFDEKTGDYSVSFEKNIVVNKDIFSGVMVDDLLIISDIEITNGIDVRYPYIVDARPGDNDTAPHKWFSSNWVPGRELGQELPSIASIARGERLYAYKVAGGFRPNNDTGKGNRSSSVLQDGKSKNACTGIMKIIFPDRGFGFIDTSDGDLFVHYSVFPEGEFDRLSVGTQVNYIKGKGKNEKECAVSAKIIG